MLQAEIGSAKVTAAGSFPTRGHLMPDFTLSSSDGKQVSLYDYRGRSNLVLLFAGRAQDSAEDSLLSALPTRYREITDTDSEVVVVVAESVDQAARTFAARCSFRFQFCRIRICGFITWSEHLARRRCQLPHFTLLTGFWRYLPCGARASETGPTSPKFSHG